MKVYYLRKLLIEGLSNVTFSQFQVIGGGFSHK